MLTTRKTSFVPLLSSMRRMSNKAHQPRVPLIKFVGKRDLTQPQTHASTRPTLSTAPVQAAVPVQHTAPVVQSTKKPAFSPKPIKPHHPNAVDYSSLKAGFMHGRKKLSSEEMLAIELGGACAVI